MSADIELVGFPAVRAMISRTGGVLMDAAIENVIKAAGYVYRDAVPSAAPRLVGPKLIAQDRSEHGNGWAFYVDITPANNIWNMYEKGRTAGYTIPGVRKNQRIALNKILASEDGSFGPVLGPVSGGAMAPMPFLSKITEAKADEAVKAATERLTIFLDDAR